MSLRHAIRVASVPSSHVYVRHLAPLSSQDTHGAQVVRLPDPDPKAPDRPAASQWWPPAMLDEEWIESHADDFDLFHVHFGFDALSVKDLTAIIDALNRHGKPLVYTVHDLRNPHHELREEHDAQLDVLVPRADALITLTDGAAREIHKRWNRTAEVIPHPHVVELPVMDHFRYLATQHDVSARATSQLVVSNRAASEPIEPQPFRIGVHVKSLRASMNPLPVIQALVDLARQDGDIIVQVNGHRDVLEPDGAKYAPELAAFLDGHRDSSFLDLHIHDFFPDADLWDYLAGLDASVLPYSFGTHSGWLEACRDLGTAVVAPDCGFYADQGPVHSYHHDEYGLDEASLRAAVQNAIAAAPTDAVTSQWRAEQRVSIAERHANLYAQVLANATATGNGGKS